MATIDIITGCMFSGKTTELLKRCAKYNQRKVLYINHSHDSRCSNEIKTHTNKRQKAFKTDLLDNATIGKHTVIAIDEAQFFTDLLFFVLKHEHLNITIIIAGLDGDFRRNKFGEILDVIPYANTVTRLSAKCNVCNDGTPGIFSQRKTASTDQVNVGDENIYESVCRCHYRVYT